MGVFEVPFVNALGKTGPEESAGKIVRIAKLWSEGIKVDNSNIEKSVDTIYKKALDAFRRDGKNLFIGGDHSITYPIFKAFNKVYENSFLIVFDAHADSMPAMREPTNEEFLRAIIEEGFDPEKVILVGVRRMDPEEEKFLELKGVKIFGEIYDLKAIGDYITKKANGFDVYISIDMDVLDPAFAPGVNYAEPNGLSSKELFYLLRRLFCIKSLKAMDVVEVDLLKDKKYGYITAKTAARILREFEGKI